MFAFYFKTEVEAGKGVGLDLTREGHTIAHIYAGGPTSTVYETAGDLEVVHLNKGERLWTVKFDHIYVNSGGGFDPKTGVFTAPAEGLYVFFIK
nr:hypothetical protein BaRGS_013762 [Batillaria attramentaria]